MTPDGKVTLSRQVFRLDDGHRIYRRRRTAADRAQDIFFLYLLPAAVILLLAACWVLLFWIGAAVQRMLRGEGI